MSLLCFHNAVIIGFLRNLCVIMGQLRYGFRCGVLIFVEVVLALSYLLRQQHKCGFSQKCQYTGMSLSFS